MLRLEVLLFFLGKCNRWLKIPYHNLEIRKPSSYNCQSQHINAFLFVLTSGWQHRSSCKQKLLLYRKSFDLIKEYTLQILYFSTSWRGSIQFRERYRACMRLAMCVNVYVCSVFLNEWMNETSNFHLHFDRHYFTCSSIHTWGNHWGPGFWHDVVHMQHAATLSPCVPFDILLNRIRSNTNMYNGILLFEWHWDNWNITEICIPLSHSVLCSQDGTWNAWLWICSNKYIGVGRAERHRDGCACLVHVQCKLDGMALCGSLVMS